MILQAIEEIGFENPTPIQNKTIPHIINSGTDLIALAQTGTGKTAAFALPVIQQLYTDDDSVQSLILCPTRELAMQIASDIETFIKYLPDVKVVPVYGGERIDKQIRAMKKKPQIVVGTPGRVNDMIRRHILKVNSIKWLILDEADEMLNMGFKEELDDILKTMPERKQVLLFSATMNAQIRRIANNYMKKPEDITVGDKNKGAENVQHFYYVVHEKDRYLALRRIADINPDIHGIVFCRTRRETQQIADKLIQDHYSAEAIHGEISQEQRTQVMSRFRDHKTQLLVATDVAARGIDVSGLTHIINYTLPDGADAYVHRSGRTGRANNMGISLVIVNMREKHRVRDLERKIGKPFKQGQIPSGDDICENQLFSLIEKVRNIEINEKQINKYMELLEKKFDKMDRDELLKRFVSVEFNRFLEQYKNASDLNSGMKNEKAERYDTSSMSFARFQINVGKRHGLDVKDLFQFLNTHPDLRRVEIGDINIKKDHTLFDVDENYQDKILEHFKDADMNGIEVKISCKGKGIKSTRKPQSRKPKGRPSHRHDSKGHAHRKKRY